MNCMPPSTSAYAHLFAAWPMAAAMPCAICLTHAQEMRCGLPLRPCRCATTMKLWLDVTWCPMQVVEVAILNDFPDAR